MVRLSIRIFRAKYVIYGEQIGLFLFGVGQWSETRVKLKNDWSYLNTVVVLREDQQKFLPCRRNLRISSRVPCAVQ